MLRSTPLHQVPDRMPPALLVRHAALSLNGYQSGYMLRRD
jgi:hypothetical protein